MTPSCRCTRLILHFFKQVVVRALLKYVTRGYLYRGTQKNIALIYSTAQAAGARIAAAAAALFAMKCGNTAEDRPLK